MGIEIIDTLAQKNNGIFPLVDTNDVKGGFYQVGSIQTRDEIPLVRRREGMLCHVTDDRIYQLLNGIDNENWVEFKVGSDFDGDYNSLINKPTIPDKTSQLENDSGFITIDDVDTSQNHLHGNKNVLDGITQDKVNQWDSKADKECEVFVGENEPQDKYYPVWIDTSDNEQITNDISDAVIEEFRSVIDFLKNEIKSLKTTVFEHEARIEYLELHGGGGNPTPPDPEETEYISLVFEDGKTMVFEDGETMTFEDKNTVSQGTKMLFEDNKLMLFEDDKYLIFE